MAELTNLEAYKLGYLRARREARRELRDMAQRWDDEPVSLQNEFNSLAKVVRTMEDAIGMVELRRDPDAVLH